MSTTKIARVSLLLLAIQLALVCSVAAKYLMERSTCPKVWTRAVAYDPEMVMRGRYLSIQVYVNACTVTLPPVASYAAIRPHEVELFDNHGVAFPYLNARIGARDGKLVALGLVREEEASSNDQSIAIRNGSPCDAAYLQQPVDVYLSETAKSPFPLDSSKELWVELSIPPSGPPRPIQLALKFADGQWKPLNYR
jgi:hypothetical protein